MDCPRGSKTSPVWRLSVLFCTCMFIIQTCLSAGFELKPKVHSLRLLQIWQSYSTCVVLSIAKSFCVQWKQVLLERIELDGLVASLGVDG